MGVLIIEKLGAGQFADIYRARDSIDRLVAIKLIRSSMGSDKFAMEQARALGRVEHPNVVTIHGVEQIEDPDTKQMVIGIVMELVEGRTLSEVFKLPPLEMEQCRRIGDGIINGVEHIHKQGIAHGDLHAENILVDFHKVKIIDILYYDTLAQVSTQSKDERQQADLVQLRHLISNLLEFSRIERQVAARFGKLLSRGFSIGELREAFHIVLQQSTPTPQGKDTASNIASAAADAEMSTANSARHRLERIHSKLTDFATTCRRLKMEWAVELKTKDRDVKPAFAILSRLRDAILTLAEQIDEHKHFGSFTRIQWFLEQIAELLRREFVDKRGDDKFWNLFQSLQFELENLNLTLKHEKWEDK